MVKRHKPDEIAGVLEFAGRTEADEEFKTWLAEHKAGKGGRIRVGLGATGIRVMFSKEADLAAWKMRLDTASKARKSAAAC